MEAGSSVRGLEELDAWILEGEKENVLGSQKWLSQVTISRRRNELLEGSLAPLATRATAFGRLESLVLYDDELRSTEGLEAIADEAGATLRELNLGRNCLSSLAGLARFATLDSLWLEENELTRLPGLSALKQLRVLRLSHNKLLRLDVTGLAKLEELAVDSNELVELPRGLATCTALRMLNARANGLAAVADDVARCPSLRVLSLSSNKLSTLPGELRGLQHLETIHLNANAFQALPAALFEAGACPALKRANLASNKIDLSDVAHGATREPFGDFVRDAPPHPPNDRFVKGDRVIVVVYQRPDDTPTPPADQEDEEASS